jgi:hypothetical protein
MNIYFLQIFIIVLLFCFLIPVQGQIESSYIPAKRSLAVGEELTYEVSYSFIKLGTVILKIKDKTKVNGKSIYSAVAQINSYSGIPFVDLHQIYESRFDDLIIPVYFRGLVKYEDHTSYTEYDFDYKKNKISIEKGRVYPPQVWTDSTTTADKHYQDGLSIFYFARMNLGKNKSINIPCFVSEEKVYTTLNFYTENKRVNIDAVDYDIDCLHLDGETDFVSVFGLTGYFEGWFTNDEASIPVIAKMKVIIGSITLELREWKRKGWDPPKYTAKK